jgi:hypothetical protein
VSDPHGAVGERGGLGVASSAFHPAHKPVTILNAATETGTQTTDILKYHHGNSHLTALCGKEEDFFFQTG